MGSGAAGRRCEQQAWGAIRASLCDRALMPPSVCHRGGTPVPAGQGGIRPGLEKFPAPGMSLRDES